MLINLHPCEHGSYTFYSSYTFSHYAAFLRIHLEYADPSGRAVSGVGLRSLAGWDCGLESRRGGMMDVCLLCCILSYRGLCIELISRPEESCQLWCV